MLSRTGQLLVVLLLVVGLLPFVAGRAEAVVGTPTSYQGNLYSSGAGAASADKPQSKLWYNAGSWWALMVNTAGTVNIFKLDRTTHRWSDTGTVVDERRTSTGDALWTNDKLYVASRTGGGSGQIRVYRYSYSPTSGYSRDAGFPASPAGAGGSESVTIDRDSTGKLWITFTRGSAVWVAHSTTSDNVWAAPYRIPGLDTAVSSDDLSAVIALPSKIGVMWSDQQSSTFGFALHTDGADDTAGSWTFETPLAGTRMADDHINLKSLLADDQGRVHAAIKTSRGDDAADLPSDPSIVVLTRSGTGTWTNAQAAAVSDGLTRPQLALDRTNGLLFVLQSREGGGAVYYKSTPLSNISFGPGRGADFIRWSGAKINNVSTMKEPVSAATGLVAIASDEFAKRYYHAEMSLGQAP